MTRYLLWLYWHVRLFTVRTRIHLYESHHNHNAKFPEASDVGLFRVCDDFTNDVITIRTVTNSFNVFLTRLDVVQRNRAN